jgi:hypothetical protein
MKLIRVDSFNREGPGYDDKLIQGGLTKEEAQASADALNALDKSPHSPDFYRVVPEDYELFKFEP